MERFTTNTPHHVERFTTHSGGCYYEKQIFPSGKIQHDHGVSHKWSDRFPMVPTAGHMSQHLLWMGRAGALTIQGKRQIRAV